MKIRNGFVSNSSSSSFIMVYKEGFTREDLIKKVFKIDKSSILYSFTEQITEVLLSGEKYFSVKELVKGDDFRWMSDEQRDKVLDKFQEGKIVILGDVSDEGNSPAEDALCSMEIMYEDEDIFIEKRKYY